MDPMAAARTAAISEAAMRFVKVGTATLAMGSVAGNLAARWFMRRAHRWHLSDDTARNVFVYVMEIVVTTAAFAVSCATLRALFADSSMLVHEEAPMACLGVVLGALGAMYITELNFKPRLGWPLAFHHVSTIAMGVYLAVFFAELAMDGAADAACAVAASLVIMSLTEQCVFVGLLARRGEAHGVARCVAAATAVITAATTAVITACPRWPSPASSSGASASCRAASHAWPLSPRPCAPASPLW